MLNPLIAKFVASLIDPSQIPSLVGQCFSRLAFSILLFFTSSNIVRKTNDTTQLHLNLYKQSLSMALDSRTLGLTYNIPYLIVMNLSLDNVGLPFNSNFE